MTAKKEVKLKRLSRNDIDFLCWTEDEYQNKHLLEAEIVRRCNAYPKLVKRVRELEEKLKYWQDSKKKARKK